MHRLDCGWQQFLQRLVKLLAVSFILSTPLLAQQGRGTISGTVTDPSGAAVPGASITITSVGTNAVFSTQSNEEGFFTAPGLAVGEYVVNAERQGFKKAVRKGITLQVDQKALVNIRMDIGEIAESVEVVAETSLVDAGSATLGTVIENRRVSDLPLNGRNALSLTLLNAGVVSNAGPTNSGFGDRGVQISSLSINGSPSSMNSQMLDGNNNVLSYVGRGRCPASRGRGRGIQGAKWHHVGGVWFHGRRNDQPGDQVRYQSVSRHLVRISSQR